MIARILPCNPKNLRKLAQEIWNDKLVAIPTETVYGLAANYQSETAILKIFKAKKRPFTDPLITHIPNLKNGDITTYLQEHEICDFSGCTSNFLNSFKKLTEAFWPGPLTLVLPKHPKLSHLITSNNPTVAIRMPRHPKAQAFLKEVGLPLVAPSANRFGRISPTCPEDVFKELGHEINWILDGGKCQVGLESTILSLGNYQKTGNSPHRLLRPGRVSSKDIEKVLGRKISFLSPRLKERVPGHFKTHYAPLKPLRILPTTIYKLNKGNWLNFLQSKSSSGARTELTSQQTIHEVGLLAFYGNGTKLLRHFHRVTGIKAVIKILCPKKNNLDQAARNLFCHMRNLDDQNNIKIIFSEPFKSALGVGPAITNRIARASGGIYTQRAPKLRL